MSTKKDGGPAFPCEPPIASAGKVEPGFWAGMALRDYFAAAALTGFVADAERFDRKAPKDAVCARVADHCYALADAMLAEREKETK